MEKLFKIRAWQLFREFREIGMIRTAFVWLLVLPFAFLLLSRGMGVAPYNYLLPLAILYGLGWVHRRRRDYIFLFHIADCPRWVCWIEYLVYTVFVPVILLYRGQIGIAGMYLLLLAALVFLPVRTSAAPVYKKLTAWVPAALFEWKSGIRSQGGGLVVGILIGLGGGFSFWAAMAAFFVFASVFTAFYVENEPLVLLAAGGEDEHRFLRRKLFSHLRCLAVFLLPFLGIACLHFSYILYSLLAYTAVLNVVGFAILWKYAYYRPCVYPASRPLILTIVCLCSVFLPILFLWFFLNLFLYRKALNNLKGYFYATD